MDPFTIGLSVCTVAKGIWTVGSSIYTFMQSTLEIDATLDSLLSELDSLTKISTTIDGFLDSPAFKTQQVENGESLVRVLKPLRASLENCEQSLKKFEVAIKSMTAKDGKRNLIDKTKSKIKLDMKASDLVTHRAQIVSHVATLQVAFQTLNLFVTIHSSEMVIQNLGPRIDRLGELLEQMRPQYTYNSWQIELSHADAARLQEDTLGLKNVAEKILSDAKTIMSTDQGSIRDPHPVQVPEKQKVSHWNIQSVHDVRRAARVVGVMKPHIETIPEDDDGTRIAMSRLVKYGDTEGRAGQLAKAERFYRQALERRSSNDRPSIDRYNATLKLAKVLSQQTKYNDAKEVLAPTCARPKSIRSMPIPEAEVFTEACHFLIGVLIELKELDEAKVYCERAMVVASHGYGKDSAIYQESARLLGVVLETRDGEEDSNSSDEAGPSEQMTQPSQALERTNTIKSEDSESSTEASMAAPRQTLDSGRPSSSGSVPQFKLTSDIEHNGNKTADIVSSRSNSKSPSSSARQAHKSIPTRPMSEKRHTGATFKSAASSSSMLRPLSVSTTSTTPLEPPVETPQSETIRKRQTENDLETDRKPVSILLNTMNNNAKENMAGALKILETHHFFIAFPPTYIKSSQFDPEVALRKAIYTGLVGVVWILLFRLADVKTRWEKLNRTMGISMFKSKTSKFPQFINPKYEGKGRVTFMEDLYLSDVPTNQRKQIAELLLQYGVDVHPPNPQCSPLLSEAESGHYKVVEILVQYGAIPKIAKARCGEDAIPKDAKPRDGDNALQYILGEGDKSSEEAASLLVKYGANPNLLVKSSNETLLCRAAGLDWQRAVEILILRGADLEIASLSGSPLCIAAAKGFTQVALILMDNKANIETQSGYKLGGTPLYIAASNGHSQLVKKLLEHGAKIEANAGDGTALCIAAAGGYLDVVNTLLHNGANVEAIDRHGETPLCVATSHNHAGVVQALIDDGASTEAQSSDGTPLCMAASHGYIEIVSKLLESDADVRVSDPSGHKPLELAASNGFQDIVKVMLEYDGLRFSRKEIRAALNLAILKGHLEAEMLLREILAETKASD